MLAVGVANRWLGQDLLTRRAIRAAQDRQIDTFLSMSAPRMELDPVLGWRYRAGYAGNGDTTNAAGLRGSREYGASAPPGSVRLAAFGDSFVYCAEVGPSDCWTAQVEAGWSAEVLNYGVGGYGTDQALLRYVGSQERASPSPTVLIGFAPVNVRRNVNRYRRFVSPREGILFKPRFLTDETGELRYLPPPVGSEAELRAFRGSLEALQRAGENDYWYEPIIYENPLIDWLASVRLISWTWVRLDKRLLDPDRMWTVDLQLNPESRLFALQLKLLRSFADSVAASGSSPHFVIFPDRDSVGRHRMGGPTQYGAMVDSLETGEVPVLDLIDAMGGDSTPVPDLFMPGGHYSPVGNALAARAISVRLGLQPR